ncbi:hypothetical protein Q3G72_025657 [Acer saccharum]|nr:hypothetical protein Q3G72_009900 [Acer saccharum]KAK1568540.1 hypothetical protein Q3G72_025657 [Acer saccharum]
MNPNWIEKLTVEKRRKTSGRPRRKRREPLQILPESGTNRPPKRSTSPPTPPSAAGCRRQTGWRWSEEGLGLRKERESEVYFARTGWLAIAVVPTPIAFFLLIASGSETVLRAR